MFEAAGPRGWAPRRPGHWALVGALIGVLLLVGVYDEPIFAFLTARWQQVLAAVGLGRQAEALQQGINGGITKRLLPAVATYAAVYLSLCLLLLRRLLTAPEWRLALRLYAGTLVVYVGMVLLNKLFGEARWAYQLSRQVLDFVVSPLPVGILYVLFRAGFGPRPDPTAG